MDLKLHACEIKRHQHFMSVTRVLIWDTWLFGSVQETKLLSDLSKKLFKMCFVIFVTELTGLKYCINNIYIWY